MPRSARQALSLPLVRAVDKTFVETSNPPVDRIDHRSEHRLECRVGERNVWCRPVVVGDAVYVGTDNARHMNPAIEEEAGVLMAFHAKDGKFLWQDVAPRVERGLREFLLPSTTSAPYVEGNRLYYVTAECQLRCLDTRVFVMAEQWCVSGGGLPGRRCGRHRSGSWTSGRLGVFPHEATNSEVLPVGDLLMVSTSNGQNEGHTRVPSPRARSLIAVDKRSGEVVWRAIGPGGQVLHRPVVQPCGGQCQWAHPGALRRKDGWLRSYDAASGHEIWRLDNNPKAPAFFRGPESFRAALSSLHRSSTTAASSLRWDRVPGTATDPH